MIGSGYCQKMKRHKCQYPSDNLARGFAVVEQFEGVRGGGVINECEG